MMTAMMMVMVMMLMMMMMMMLANKDSNYEGEKSYQLKKCQQYKK